MKGKSNNSSHGLGGIGFVRRPGEYTDVKDASGGLISQFTLILAQTGGYAALMVLGVCVILLTLWSLPSEIWWGILTLAYALIVLAVGVWLFFRVHDELGESYLSVVVSAVPPTVLWAAAIYVFDKWIWDWLDHFTVQFFCARLPAANSWTLATAVFAALTVLLLTARKLWTLGTLAAWLGCCLASLGMCYLWLTTAEWYVPTLHFYLIVFPLATAILVALREGAIRMQRDLAWPTWGSVPIPEEEEEPKEFVPEHRYTLLNPNEKRPLVESGPIINVTGPHGEEWAIAENSLIQFIKLLPARGRKESDWLSSRSWRGVQLDAGLIVVNQKTGRKRRKDAPITQWADWAPFYHFLAQASVHDGRGNVDPLFLDSQGRPDPEAILAYLELNGYPRGYTETKGNFQNETLEFPERTAEPAEG